VTGSQGKVSCDPHTIWALSEAERPPAVISLIQECAREFQNAVQRDDADAAQDFAVFALSAIGGLFPDPSDPAQALLTSLVGLLADAKGGRTEHILMRSTKPISGTRRGFGQAYVAGFAISAVKVLIERNLLTMRAARIEVAQMLAKTGYSLRRGDHDEPKPITQGAIRNWSENAEDYPLHNAMAADMAPIHANNLAQRSASTLAEIRAYLQDQAIAAVKHSRGL